MSFFGILNLGSVSSGIILFNLSRLRSLIGARMVELFLTICYIYVLVLQFGLIKARENMGFDYNGTLIDVCPSSSQFELYFFKISAEFYVGFTNLFIFLT